MAFLYYNMACLITIGAVTFDVVESVSIKQDIKQLSDTARLTVPRNFTVATDSGQESLRGKYLLEFIKVGDPVEIKLGYDDSLETEFSGYVTHLGADAPLRIECEDEMYQLRQKTYNKVLESAKLSELLALVAPGYEVNLVDEDIELGKFTIENASAYQVLETLRKDYMLYSYFTGKVLHCGFIIDPMNEAVHTYHLARNVKDLGRLEYTRKGDVKIRIKAISNNRDGTKEVVELGDEEGSIRTLNYANKTKAELKKLAEKQLKTLDFDGWRGSFTAFGQPVARAGDSMDLVDPEYPSGEHDGRYIIESVAIKFNSSRGFERDIKPGLKL